MILEVLEQCREKAKSQGLSFSKPHKNIHPELGHYVSFEIQCNKADEIEEMLKHYGLEYQRDEGDFMTFFSVQEID